LLPCNIIAKSLLAGGSDSKRRRRPRPQFLEVCTYALKCLGCMTLLDRPRGAVNLTILSEMARTAVAGQVRVAMSSKPDSRVESAICAVHSSLSREVDDCGEPTIGMPKSMNSDPNAYTRTFECLPWKGPWNARKMEMGITSVRHPVARDSILSRIVKPGAVSSRLFCCFDGRIRHPRSDSVRTKRQHNSSYR